jgi:hypothetical protein
MRKLKLNTEQGVIGSRFTWSFIKIVPVLVLLPVLSFYLFSFGSIRDNLKKAEETTAEFNSTASYVVEELSNNTEFIVFKYYRDRTVNIGKLLEYFKFFSSSPTEMQLYLNLIVRDGFACELKLFDSGTLVAQSKSDKVCLPDYGHDLSTDSFILRAYYASDLNISNLTNKMMKFEKVIKEAEIKLNTSIIQTRFMIDFSSTILLAVLSALLIILRMIDQLMRPMHNLSVATREICSGNYDVEIEQDPKNKDLHDLIGHFNEMSKRIKQAREGLDTHNLYLETILK